MHFGLYLYRKGVINAEQLVRALELQLKRVVPIGQLALEECVLSAREVFNVLQAQHSWPHERFGELAIEMGLMSRDDLMRLLLLQSDRQMPLDEILMRQGVLTQEQVERELDEFRRVQLMPTHARATTTIVRPPHHRSKHATAADTLIAI